MRYFISEFGIHKPKSVTFLYRNPRVVAEIGLVLKTCHNLQSDRVKSYCTYCVNDLCLCTVRQRDDLWLSDLARIDLNYGHATIRVANRLQHCVLSRDLPNAAARNLI